MSHTITARPPTTATLPRRLVLTAAVLIVVAAVLTGLWISTSRDTAPPAPAVVNRSGSGDGIPDSPIDATVSGGSNAVPAGTPSTRYPGTVPPATTPTSSPVEWDWEPCRPNLPC